MTRSKIKILSDFAVEVLLKAALFAGLMVPGSIALDYVAQLLA